MHYNSFSQVTIEAVTPEDSAIVSVWSGSQKDLFSKYDHACTPPTMHFTTPHASSTGVGVLDDRLCVPLVVPNTVVV